MAAPAIGLRPRVATRPFTDVDWSHPLSQGLTFCVAGMPVDLVSGNSGSQQSSPTLGTTRFGNALATTSTTAGTWHFPNTAAVRTIATQCTIAWFGVITAQAADSTLLSVPTTALWANPFANVSLRRQGSGTNVQIGFAGFEAASKEAAIAGWSLGEHCYVAIRDGANVTAYDNGLQLGTEGGNSTAANDWSTPQPVALLGRWATAQNDGVGGAVSFAALWNRPLSVNEIAALQADPFQMLRS